MAAQLFYLPFRPALDMNAFPIAGAKVYFYLHLTNTLAPIYEGSSLTTLLPNPVTADAAGRWPSIYLDDSVTYRVVVKDASDTTIPGFDVDPYIASIADELTPELEAILDDALAAQAAAELAETNAEAAQAAAEAAANTYNFPIQLYVRDDVAVEEGAYYSSFYTPFTINSAVFRTQVVGGTGTCSVTLAVNDEILVPDVATSTTLTSEDIDALIPAGATISVVISDISGTVTGVFTQIEGLPQ